LCRVPGLTHVYGYDPKKDPANFGTVLQYQEIKGGKVRMTDSTFCLADDSLVDFIRHQFITIFAVIIRSAPSQAVLYVIDRVLKIPS
jgi:hypothetical protein